MFVYLGQQMCEDGHCDEEVKRRISIAKKVFNDMKEVLTSRKINISTRKRIIKCYILSTFMYGAETWTLNAYTRGRIDAFEMWLHRRMLKI